MNDFDCSRALIALYDYLDGELTAERRSRIQYHLDSCPHCFSAYDFEAELRMVVRSRLRADVPPALTRRIAEAIEQERLGPAGGLRGGPSTPPPTGSMRADAPPFSTRPHQLPGP